MNEHDVHVGIVKHKARRRVGRGVGSGMGKTSTRGHNGHKSRSGYSRHPMFNGGDLPLVRRIPKRGFHNKFASVVFGVNVSDLNTYFEAGAEVNPITLRECGLVKVVCDEVKILGDGEITKALKVTVTRVSEGAKQKIEAAGGTVTIIAAKRTPKERVAALKAGEAE
jgi:large subunit ribosomal protein L15